MSRAVKNTCYLCDKIIKAKVNIVYISGAITASHWRDDDRLDILFQGKRTPRAAIHRECWDDFFLEKAKEKNEQKNIKNVARFKKIL